MIKCYHPIITPLTIGVLAIAWYMWPLLKNRLNQSRLYYLAQRSLKASAHFCLYPCVNKYLFIGRKRSNEWSRGRQLWTQTDERWALCLLENRTCSPFEWIKLARYPDLWHILWQPRQPLVSPPYSFHNHLSFGPLNRRIGVKLSESPMILFIVRFQRRII